MPLDYATFVTRANALRAKIAAACAAARRDPASVELLAVTKTHGAWAAEYAARYGLRGVGENRVQEGVEKRAQLTAATAPLRWELIGHLQSNKARLAAAHFDRVQSVDSEKLLEKLDRAAAELERPLAVLLQINAGRDPAKFGAEIEDAPRLVDFALSRPQLKVEGLMTIAPLSADPSVAARTFETLRALRDELVARFRRPLPELSMGMSGDLRPAILAGSTQVRIGTALFGTRD
ncbi:MAG TPA: YggS family pyridoxal phosphate-dependent enzyme [Candidatus Synoicihabitans sp.]|nr:YggS family pyridoxal phosphate-dependent enzyme [Candidatus Synoicihabitans sp.]